MMVKLGIIVGSTREGRVSPQVAAWVNEQAKKFEGIETEIVDIHAYDLPFVGTGEANQAFGEKIDSFDGFIFVVAEYNHSITASLKNALDTLRPEWANKVAGIVSYGSLGGARAAEHLRGILGELQVADVRSHVALSMFTDFEGWQTFQPADMHLTNLTAQFEQLLRWGTALKTTR
jgi:NAD(P)H-dependent FMN reductase